MLECLLINRHQIQSDIKHLLSLKTNCQSEMSSNVSKSLYSNWIISTFIGAALFYRNNGYDRTLGIFILCISIIFLLEYGLSCQGDIQKYTSLVNTFMIVTVILTCTVGWITTDSPTLFLIIGIVLTIACLIFGHHASYVYIGMIVLLSCLLISNGYYMTACLLIISIVMINFESGIGNVFSKFQLLTTSLVIGFIVWILPIIWNPNKNIILPGINDVWST